MVTDGSSSNSDTPEFFVEDDDLSMSTRSSTSDMSSTESNTDSSSDSTKKLSLVSVRVFLVLICWFCITQGFAINGVANVNVPMLERRFGFTSTQAGLVASFYDIVGGAIVLFVGYFGANRHQPRILGCASLCLALGSFTMSLPHFITPPYQPPNLMPDVCDASDNTTETLCTHHSPGLSNYLYVFLLGQGLHGLAGTCLFTLGVSFLDGSVSSKKSPVYLGFFYACSAAGPAIGYVVGGLFLEHYVDIPASPPQGLTPSSPGWVGAWWLGFIISAISCFLLSYPLMLFPRELPGTRERKRHDKNQAHDDGSYLKVNKDGFGQTLEDMPYSLWILVKNPVFVCISLIAACDGLLVGGMAPFLPKYIANQFGQRASTSAIITGSIGVPAAIIGQFLGGWIVGKLNLQVKGILKMNMLSCMCFIALTGSLWIKCDLKDIAGVTHPYVNEGTNISGLTQPCNEDCRCTLARYDPVCIDGLQYFSACHASCSHPGQLNEAGITIYEDCSCAEVHNRTTFHKDSNTTTKHQVRSLGTAGECDSQCASLFIFGIALFCLIMVKSLTIVPAMTITMRSVAEKQRTLAVSTQQVCLRSLGTIPGPLVMGFVMDLACVLWQEKCDEKGSCWIYDNHQMSQDVFILAVSVKFISFILYTVAHLLYKKPSVSESLVKESLSSSYGSTE